MLLRLGDRIRVRVRVRVPGDGRGVGGGVGEAAGVLAADDACVSLLAPVRTWLGLGVGLWV